MTAGEHLERTRDRIEELCAPLSADRANWRGQPGNWTIHEIVEHLAVTERRLLLGVLRSLKGNAATIEELAEAEGKAEMILDRVPVRSTKITAPEAVRPVGGYGEWPGALEGFREARLKTLSAEANASEEFDRRVFPHPMLGNLTLRQWLLFAAAHAERHALQIEEVQIEEVQIEEALKQAGRE